MMRGIYTLPKHANPVASSTHVTPMLGNLVAIVLLVAAILAVVAGIRAAWRTKKAIVRWTVAVVGGPVTALLIVVAGGSIRGIFEAYPKLGRPVQAMTVDR